MSLFSDNFKAAKCKSQFSERSYSHSTGLDLVDLANGSYDPARDKFNVGMRAGRTATFVGYTGSGKTTLCQQAAAGIAQQFENAAIIPFDTEKSWNMTRFMNLYTRGDANLLKKFEEQTPMKIINTDTYLDDLRGLISDLAEFKETHRDDLMEEITDINGDKVVQMAPTIIIPDSIAALFSRKNSENIEEGGEDNNMAGAQAAKENNAFFSKILNTLFKYNIILLNCNHITTNIKTDMFSHPQSKLPWMKAEENIKGGNGHWYFADFFVRINPGSKLDPEKDYKINGRINNFQIIKSRGNESGATYPLVFNSTTGYDNILSDVEYLYSEGLIKAAGPRSKLVNYPEYSFTKSTVKAEIEKHPELEEVIRKEVYESFKSRMPKMTDASDEIKTEMPKELEA